MTSSSKCYRFSSKRVPVILLAVVLLALFGTFLFERSLTFTIREGLGKEDHISIENIKIHGKTVSSVKHSIGKNNWFDLSISFRVHGPLDLENLFQTSDVNAGIRAEFSGDRLGLVISDLQAVDKVKGFSFASRFEAGEWHHIRIKALQDGYLSAWLDGKDLWLAPRYRPYFALDRILIGAGFSNDRVFSGDIRNVEVRVGRSISASSAEALVLFVKALLIVTLLFALQFCRWPQLDKLVFTKGGAFDPLLHMRAIACFMVVMGHGVMGTFVAPNLGATADRNPILLLAIAAPWAGVWIFFALSGYLMGKAFHSERYQLSSDGIMAFYRNRFLRIAPLYWLAIGVVLLADQSFRQLLSDPVSVARLLLGDNDGEMRLNPIGSLWSVSTEFQFYLAVPIICALVSKIRRSASVLLLIAGCVMYGVLFRTIALEGLSWDLWQREVYKSLLGNLDIFLIGLFSSIIVGKCSGSQLRYGVVGGYALIACIYVISAKFSHISMIQGNPASRAVLFQFLPTLFALCTAGAIILFELASTNESQFAFFGKRLEIFGVLTYGIYVWHEPILHEISRIAPVVTSSFQSVVLCLLGLVAAILASAVTNYFFERKFERRKVVPKIKPVRESSAVFTTN